MCIRDRCITFALHRDNRDPDAWSSSNAGRTVRRSRHILRPPIWRTFVRRWEHCLQDRPTCMCWRVWRQAMPSRACSARASLARHARLLVQRGRAEHEHRQPDHHPHRNGKCADRHGGQCQRVLKRGRGTKPPPGREQHQDDEPDDGGSSGKPIAMVKEAWGCHREPPRGCVEHRDDCWDQCESTRPSKG